MGGKLVKSVLYLTAFYFLFGLVRMMTGEGGWIARSNPGSTDILGLLVALVETIGQALASVYHFTKEGLVSLSQLVTPELEPVAGGLLLVMVLVGWMGLRYLALEKNPMKFLKLK